MNGKILSFLYKRILLCYVFLSIIDILFMKDRWLILAGLTIGGAAAVFRLNYTASMLLSLFGSGGDKAGQPACTLKYTISLLSLVAMLAASVIYDPWLFAGAAAGILISPMVIMINGLTEGFGITHNGFGCGGDEN